MEPTPIARAHAATLACGEDAALSHDTAGALWGVNRWPPLPEVTASKERRRARIRTHRSGTLAGDVTTQFGIRVTTPVRTVIDIAPRRSDRELIRAIDDLRLAGHLKPSRLAELRSRSCRARALIDPGQNPTRSTLEIDFIAFIKRHRLPMPRINAPFHGRIVDALYPAERLIIELDSYTYHQDPNTFREDRERDGANRELGHETHRITGDRFTAREAQRLRTILAARRRLIEGAG